MPSADLPVTVPLTGPINLLCRVGAGSVTVRAVDELSEAAVTLRPRRAGSDVPGRCTVALRGATLAVECPRPRVGRLDLSRRGSRPDDRDAVDVEILVPAGTAMKLSSHTARITTHGRIGSADISCGASTVELDQVDGELRLHSGTGSITVGRISGAATARGGSGEIRIGECGKTLDLVNGNGGLRVGIARGRTRLRTGNGAAAIDVALADVELSSGSGALTVGLPAGQQARLDVLTGSGQLRTEMPVEQAPSGQGHPVTIRARTGSGDITIRRAVLPDSDRLAG
jgi:hypothetical protein